MNGDDLSLSAAKLFERLNITKSAQGNAEVLDKGEVALANRRGFSIFKLDNNMTQEDFEKAYNAAYDTAKSENQEEAFNEKIKEVHIKYIQQRYGLDESIRPNDGESLEDFESRVDKRYEGNVSVWLEAAKAQLEAEQDEALEPIDYSSFFSPKEKLLNSINIGHPYVRFDLKSYIDKKYNEILAEKGEVTEEDLNALEPLLQELADRLSYEYKMYDKMIKEEAEKYHPRF